MNTNTFQFKKFAIVVLLTSIWINASEVFRYFVLVMPRVKNYWNGMEGIAEMDLVIFSIWGVWDTLLTGFLVIIFWLYSRVFGNNNRSVMVSATIAWALFVLFWIATANMGYSDWSILFITLSLSWIEMVVGAYIASRLYKKTDTEPLLSPSY